MNRPEVTATRLRKARQARDLKVKDLAELVPCSESTVRAIEQNGRRMTISMAVAIGKVLHVRPAWLLDLEE